MIRPRTLRYYRWLGTAMLSVAGAIPLVLACILAALPEIGPDERWMSARLIGGALMGGAAGFLIRRFASVRLNQIDSDGSIR